MYICICSAINPFDAPHLRRRSRQNKRFLPFTPPSHWPLRAANAVCIRRRRPRADSTDVTSDSGCAAVNAGMQLGTILAA